MYYSHARGNFEIAKRLYDADLNLIPLKVDGSKEPKIRWKRYASDHFRWFQASHHFSSMGTPSGIAIVCGKTSGNLEVIDHDTPDLFDPWAALVEVAFPGLVSRLPLVATPDFGWHVYYRCPEIGGNQVLARDQGGAVRIETRGQGGYAVAPGSPLTVHVSGRPYVIVRGDLTSIPTISPGERRVLLDAARSFDLSPTKSYQGPVASLAPTEGATSGRIASVLAGLYGEAVACILSSPGDRFNRTAIWPEVLEPHGWEVAGVRGRTTYWRKPGSSSSGHHATTNHADSDLMYVFSTECPGFQHKHSYSKFAAYTILNWHGDFGLAATALTTQFSTKENQP